MPGEPRGLPRVEYAPEFKRNLRRLAKKYRRIRSDLQPLLQDLQEAERPGDLIPHTGHGVYKARVRNSDSKKGKSGGYRVIYLIEPPDTVTLLTIYSKTDQGDISAQQIRLIIEQADSRS